MIDGEVMDFVVDHNPKKSNNIIKVIGVGGGGGNAINHMYESGVHNIDYIIANTDSQVLERSQIALKIQLGVTLTNGLGAGNDPQVGADAATESADQIQQVLGSVATTRMLFVTAGMGGGTGTGAAPIIAGIAKKMGILTVGIVTLPFKFEGRKRYEQALKGVEELKKNVDSYLLIDNDLILKEYGELPQSEAFKKADDILARSAKGIADIINFPGYVNIDFADVRSTMMDKGLSFMGWATATGERRAMECVAKSLRSPLLRGNQIRGCNDLLVNISCSREHDIAGKDFQLINNFLQSCAKGSNLIWGSSYDDSLGESVVCNVVATGIPNQDNILKEFQEDFDKNLNDTSIFAEYKDLLEGMEDIIGNDFFKSPDEKGQIDEDSGFISESELADFQKQAINDVNNGQGGTIESIREANKRNANASASLQNNASTVNQKEQIPSPQVEEKVEEVQKEVVDNSKFKTIDYSDQDKCLEHQRIPSYERKNLTILSGNTIINDSYKKYKLEE